MAVVSTDETQTVSEAAEPAQPAETPPSRLVIRVKIAREDSPEPPPPAQLDKRALALTIGIGVIALLAIVWILTRVFSGDVASTPVASVVPNEEASRPLATPPTNEVAVPESPEPVRAEVEHPADVPLAPINEVMPKVPQSALQTIRGTVRVAIRVVIGQDGTVRSASSQIPGPSRYFERIALQTAKEWSFTPTIREVDREMLVRFFFRRDGVEARAEPIDTVAE